MAVGVEQIGLVLVDEIGHAIEVVSAPRIGNAVIVPLDLWAGKFHAVCVMVEIGILRVDAVIRHAG